jgi:hypothetical protein
MVLGTLALGGSVAQAATHPAKVAVKLPASSAGILTAVAAVPHSSQVWAVGYVDSGTSRRYFAAHRAGGRWQEEKAPDLGGSSGSLVAVAAAGGSVWIAGNRQQAHSIQDYPAIWKWTGTKFTPVKLPSLFAGDCMVTSLSASSATNVWAAGSISPASNGSIVMLHYNGKKWSTVAYPETNDAATTAVSTSSASNAFATDGTDLFHWNGTAWTTDGTAAGATIASVATSSAKLAYAVGYNTTTDDHVSLRFNGKTWSSVRAAKGIPDELELDSVTMSGSSAWAVGEHVSGVNAEPVILHTTGGVWQSQKSPGDHFTLSSISAESARSVYSVGWYYGTSLRTFFDVYNGRTWQGESAKL